MQPEQVAVVDGWFTMETNEPHLIGSQCSKCQTYFFPKKVSYCRNPACDGDEFNEVELSRTGTIWSYTDAQYQPPEPYIATDPFVPFAIAAVQLEREDMIIMGQLAAGITVDDVTTGTEVELVLEPLFEKDGQQHMIWKWQPKGGES
ncbi:MAG: Zn-ribbon domain-containing OB-fold protein [Pseudomonadales bacterium]